MRRGEAAPVCVTRVIATASVKHRPAARGGPDAIAAIVRRSPTVLTSCRHDSSDHLSSSGELLRRRIKK